MAVAVTPSTHTLRTCAEIRRTYGQRFIWTRGPAPRMSAPPPSSPHAGPTGGDSALAAAFGAWQRACTGAPRPAGTPHTQRAPPRTGPDRKPRSGRSRHGVVLLRAPRFSPRFTSPRPRHHSATWPRQRPTTARPPAFPHASPLHVSTRAATDHHTTIATAPNTCPFRLTAPVPSRTIPDFNSLPGGGMCWSTPHVSYLKSMRAPADCGRAD